MANTVIGQFPLDQYNLERVKTAYEAGQLTQQQIVMVAQASSTMSNRVMGKTTTLKQLHYIFGGRTMAAKTSTPFKDRDAAEAAKCPVHHTRMVYSPGEGNWYCKSVNKGGDACGFSAHPATEDITLLRGHKYTGPVKIYAASTPTPDGVPGTTIYMMLTELGIAVNITNYVDLSSDEAIQVDEATGACRLAMAFDRIDFARND